MLYLLVLLFSRQVTVPRLLLTTQLWHSYGRGSYSVTKNRVKYVIIIITGIGAGEGYLRVKGEVCQLIGVVLLLVVYNGGQVWEGTGVGLGEAGGCLG